jgi:hypothetical protein
MMIESVLISLLSVYRSQRVTPYKNKAYKYFVTFGMSSWMKIDENRYVKMDENG